MKRLFSLWLQVSKQIILLKHSLGLRNLNEYKSSFEKLQFLYELLSDLTSLVGKSKRPEMDVILDALIHVVVESKVSNIFSNLKL